MRLLDTTRTAFLLTVALGAATTARAQDRAGDMAMAKGTTMVGGQAMFRTKDIVDNAVNSRIIRRSWRP